MMDTPPIPMGMVSSPKPMQTFDDSLGSTPGGGSRRPGNLWTVEAREDMFNRRESGEGWETICLDYPKRSRHAMQQQYSMMKKQRALANGTYTPSNRRGRKRKVPSAPRSSANWMSVNSKQEGYSDDEDELSDDDEDMDMDAFEDVEDEEERDTNTAKASPIPDGPRPPGLIRSATDPISRLNVAKGTRFPNLPKSAGLQRQAYNMLSKPLVDGSKHSTDAEWSERESGAIPPQKRRKVSPDQSNGGVETPVPESPAQFFQLQGMMLDDNDVTQISEILSRGVDRTKSISEVYEMEKLKTKKAFELGVQRANRRAHEAEERYRQALYEHGDDVKFKESQWKERLAALVRDLESERRQRIALEEVRTRDVAGAMAPAGEPQGGQTGNLDERQNLIRNLEHQLLMQRQEMSRMQESCQRGIFDGCQFLVDTRLDDLQKLEHLTLQFKELRSSIDPLTGDLDDMGMKTMKKHIQKILEESARTAKTLEETTIKWQAKRNITVDSLFNSTVPLLGQWARYLAGPNGPPHIPRQEAIIPVHPHTTLSSNTLPVNANAFITNGTSTTGHEASHSYPAPPQALSQTPSHPPNPPQSAPPQPHPPQPHPPSASPHQQPVPTPPAQSQSHPPQPQPQPVHGQPPKPPQSNIITLHYGEKP